MRVFLAMVASPLVFLAGSASEPVVDTVHSPDLFSPQGIMSAAERLNKPSAGGKQFELPITPGKMVGELPHYLGICGSLHKDAWKSGRWVALTALANIAVGLMSEGAVRKGLIEEFPQFANQTNRRPVRWLLTAVGGGPSEFGGCLRETTEVNLQLRPQTPDILIGCGSAGTTEALAREAGAMRTPVISPIPFVGSGDDFPYFFRTSTSESDAVKGFLEVCKHFGWNRVGFLYQQPRLWSMVQSLRNSDTEYPLVDPFFFVDEGVIANVSKSKLRVMGLATPYSPVAMNILRIRQIGTESSRIMDKQWIIFDDEIWQAMSDYERQAWSGMMHLGAMDNSCCTQAAKQMEVMWRDMSWQTLIDWNVPKSVVTRMQQENQDLFQQSPWQGKGAFFFDAIMMALLAFRLDDKSVHAAPLDRTLTDIRLTGVSGFLNSTKHSEVKMNLRQLRAGAYVSVASLDAKRVVFTKQVIFPNGFSDPRSYDYLPSGSLSAAPPTHFELPTTPGEQSNRVHYLGFCGSLHRDVWKGGRWVALAVLANIAVDLIEEFQFAESSKQGPVRWLLTAGTEPSEEVGQAVRLLSGNFWRDVPWQHPADILIGCGSANTTEAITRETFPTRTPLISPTPFVGSEAEFPYFFRTSESESEFVKGFLQICKHFGWNRVGLLYQQPMLWSMVQSLRNSDAEYPLIDPFSFADKYVIANVSKSPLRVLGLATSYSPAVMDILRSQWAGNGDSFGIMNRQWIIFDDHLWQVMSSFERQAWNGMMHLGAMDNSCCTQTAKQLEAMWHAFSWQTLIDNKVPKTIVTRMQLENHDLFQQSPWRGKGAFFFDAIMMALLAFKLDDQSGEAAPLERVLRDVRLAGVSGFLNSAKASEARMNLRQLRAGAIVSVASLAAERVVFTKQVIFSNGGSDPRSYDYKPPTDQPQSLDYHTVRFDASKDGQQVKAQMDWGSTIIKTVIGCVVVVLVCIALPSRHNARGWARTVVDVRYPGGQSQRLSTSHHDEEIADEVTE